MSETSTTTSTSGLSVEEMMDSLTGFDEIAIGRHFEVSPYTDGERAPIMTLRALVFVHMRREGKSDVEARQAALEMTFNDVNGYFEGDDEVTPDEPVTEVGKDDSPDA